MGSGEEPHLKRFPYFTVIVAAAVLSLALRFLPSVSALTSATVGFGGNLQVGGTGTPFITCSVSNANLSLTRPTKGNGTVSTTSTLTCTNNTATSVTMNITGGTLTPAAASPPTAGFSPTAFTVNAGSSASSTFTVSANKNTTGPATYTYTFNTSTTTTGTSMDYQRNGWTITIMVN